VQFIYKDFLGCKRILPGILFFSDFSRLVVKKRIQLSLYPFFVKVVKIYKTQNIAKYRPSNKILATTQLYKKLQQSKTIDQIFSDWN